MRARESVEVIELQVASRCASASALVDESAAPTIAFIDHPLDRIRDVPGGRLMRGVGRRLSRFPTDGEPLLLHLLDQQVERPLEDAGQVSIRNTVSEQILRLAQLVAKCAACG